MIFDSTKMGCELLAHVLESSPYRVRVVGHSTDSVIPPDSPVHGADEALISGTLAAGPGSGFKLLQEIRQSASAVRCIMLLDNCGREQVIEAFRAGAVGVCGRHESFELLCKSIDCVHHGQIWANSEQLRYVLETLWEGSRIRLTDARGKALLTGREQDIVFLVAEGLRNREIAEQLKLSEHTIRNYLFRVFEKLGISSRSELILYSVGQHRRAAPR